MICNHHVKYVTEKIDEVDEMLVFASADVIMRFKIDEMDAWELLSKDGVVITAPDLEHDRKIRTVIVYYVYYR